jgi:signal transduction histidine kinase/CheY-like chemotaxis protein
MRVDRCCVAYLLRDEDRARPGPEYRCGDLPSLFGSAGELRLSDFPVCMQRLENESVAIGDVARDPTLGEGERAAILAMRGMGALLAAPLRLGEGNRVWALVVGQAGPRAWTDAEVRLVEDVAERTCAAMERARTEAALREREAELERANRAKDEFIAMLSHELRNPLAPIATTLQLMKLREPDVLVRERGVIEDQVQHLAGMVDDLLDVARIANGKLELKRERLEVGQLVAAAVDATRAAMEGRRQSLHMHVEDGLIVSGDRRRLVQVLVNLLANATKYSPPDRNIWLTATGEGDEAVLRVRDEGQGIAADVLPRVFESFIQDTHLLDRSRGGLGLGLAIVHNLVALHGGSVTAASEGRYKGSEFTVRLPLLERVREPGAVSNESETADATSPGREAERIKVLIVDDYAPAADSLALLLQEMGYRTHVVHDGGAALEAIKTFEPQVALIDIGLPVIDGYEVAQTVRRMPGRDKLPLIAVTGYGQASDHERVMEAGFDEHVVKPLDAARISELIEKMMTAG